MVDMGMKESPVEDYFFWGGCGFKKTYVYIFDVKKYTEIITVRKVSMYLKLIFVPR